MELELVIKDWEFKFLEKEASTHQGACDFLVEKIKEEIMTQPMTGLYLSSPDAGMKPSVEFWKLAQEQGPGFMSPQHFPWTLANGPAAVIAMQLGLKGPCYTFLGDESSWEAATEQAHWDLDDGLIEQALIIWISFGLNEDLINSKIRLIAPANNLP